MSDYLACTLAGTSDRADEIARQAGGNQGRSATEAFRDRLLRLTFAWCRERSRFYRERFAGIERFEGLRDLHRLPVLRRDEILRSHGDLLCDPGPPACVQYTTGTTGTFLPLYRSHAEVAFITTFYTENLRERLSRTDVLRPLQLALTSAYHGSATPIPTPAHIVTAGVYDRTQAQQAANLLATRFAFPGVEERVSAVLSGDLLLKALTAYLMDEGIDPAGTGVRTLVFTGGYTSTRTKRLLGRLWNAAAVDRYSMSEIFGGAVQAVPGAPFVFDVEVIPEIVDPATLQPITRGVGVLLMTSLYPFSQMMPMVRYHTGDLIEVVRGTAYGSDFAVRFCGRERRSVVETGDDGAVALVLAADLYDILEGLPDVAASPRFVGLASDASMEFAGKLHYALEAQRDASGRVQRIVVCVGLRYAPWLHPERVEALVTEIRMALYERSPALRERVLEGRIALDVNPVTADKVAPFNMK